MPWWPKFIIKPQLRLERVRLTAPSRPPDIVVFGIILLLVIFTLGGNIYTLVQSQPPIAATSSGSPMVILPTLESQLGLEGVAVSMVILFGIAGLALIHYSSRFVFDPTNATRNMLIGIVLLSIACLLLFYFYGIKTSR